MKTARRAARQGKVSTKPSTPRKSAISGLRRRSAARALDAVKLVDAIHVGDRGAPGEQPSSEAEAPESASVDETTATGAQEDASNETEGAQRETAGEEAGDSAAQGAQAPAAASERRSRRAGKGGGAGRARGGRGGGGSRRGGRAKPDEARATPTTQGPAAGVASGASAVGAVAGAVRGAGSADIPQQLGIHADWTASPLGAGAGDYSKYGEPGSLKRLEAVRSAVGNSIPGVLRGLGGTGLYGIQKVVETVPGLSGVVAASDAGLGLLALDQKGRDERATYLAGDLRDDLEDSPFRVMAETFHGAHDVVSLASVGLSTISTAVEGVPARYRASGGGARRARHRCNARRHTDAYDAPSLWRHGRQRDGTRGRKAQRGDRGHRAPERHFELREPADARRAHSCRHGPEHAQGCGRAG